MTVDDAPPLLLPAPRAMLATGEWRPAPATFGIHGHPDYKQAVRHVLGERAGRDEDATAAQIVCGVAIEPLRNPEAYRLHIQPSRILIEADDARGAGYGARTLAQLLTQYGDRLPCVRIQDRPAFPVRGVMLDVSRDRVPTMDQLLATIAQLGSWKINHLQLYTEHTFAYAGHATAWEGWSPITPAEIAQLQAACAREGIELAANQNCLGHLERWFAHARYAPLAEIASAEQPWQFLHWTKRGPFSLCPTDPQAMALVRDWLGQLAGTFASTLVNIGCDEAYDIGQGRSAHAVRERGVATVFADWVASVCAEVRAHGKRPLFWADIALHHPSVIARLPPDLIALVWDYEPDGPFRAQVEQLRASGRAVWVCPGTSAWRSITGRTSERRGNLLAAARDGAAAGATGYLVTSWGDEGHRQQWPIELQGLAEAAHRAWSGEAPYDTRAASLHAFGDRTLGLAPWLDDLGEADCSLRLIGGRPDAAGAPTALRNASALYTDLHKPLAEPWVGTAQEWQAVEERLGALFERAPRGLDGLLQAETMHALEEAGKAAHRAILRRRALHDRSWRPAMADSWRRLLERHRELWRARSRPGGLAHSCSFYDAIIRDLEA